MEDWKTAILALGEAVATIAEELDRFRELPDGERFELDEVAGRHISASIRTVGEVGGSQRLANFFLRKESEANRCTDAAEEEAGPPD